MTTIAPDLTPLADRAHRIVPDDPQNWSPKYVELNRDPPDHGAITSISILDDTGGEPDPCKMVTLSIEQFEMVVALVQARQGRG